MFYFPFGSILCARVLSTQKLVAYRSELRSNLAWSAHSLWPCEGFASGDWLQDQGGLH